MIIDDLKAVIDKAVPIPFVYMLDYETGEPEAYYVAVVHPGWRDMLRLTAREQYYFDRHIERFNRRQVRLGLPTYPREIIGEVGTLRGVTVMEEDA